MKELKNTVFLTGGSGFIGANLTRKLLNEGFKVHLAIKKSSDLWRINDVKKKVKIHYVDILEQKKLKSLLKNIAPNYIFHLAAYGSYPFQKDTKKIIDTNITGLFNLLNSSININYDGFVVTGSSSEYGTNDKPMKESDTLKPITFYGASKASATLLSQVFANEFKKPIIIFRPFSPYGPYEEKTRLIPTLINCIIKNKQINITPGSQKRDFIYIDDLIDAYIMVLKLKKKPTGEIFNIGSGTEHSNDEVVKALFKSINKKVPVKKGGFPKRSWDSNHWKADITKAKKILKWKPNTNLENGLKKFYQWSLK